MATRNALPSSWQRPLVLAGSTVLIIASLYWARTILIPVVMAILLTFILSPGVNFLQRRGLGRVPAVIVMVLLAFVVIGGIGGAVLLQLQNLSAELPQYQTRISEKMELLREFGMDTWLEDVNKTITELVKKSVLPVVEGLINAGFVIVLILFMLIKREDLRNRLIRLWGSGNLTQMTKALDDTGQRISRFLVMQLCINGCFGAVLATGLYFIGVPFALIWGLLGAALRYIPYLGVWVAALFPLALSFAILPGWTPLIMVVVLFAALEIVIANVMEPTLYGRTVGVSEVALLVAAAFWAWLWGPLGLLLSTPLTACLAVLGRHVSCLEALGILLGDEPVLEPHLAYYQRLLAKDQDEAADVVEEYVAAHSLEQACDDIIIPALVLAKRNRERMTEEDEQFLLQGTREIIDDLDSPINADGSDSELPSADGKVLLFGCPAGDAADELAVDVFRKLLPPRFRFVNLSARSLSAEILDRVAKEKPDLVLIGALPVRNFARTKYFCKRFRSNFPELKILVGLWGHDVLDERASRRLQEAGANQIATSLAESRDQIVPLFPALDFKKRNDSRQPAVTSA